MLWEYYDANGEEADPTGMGAQIIDYQAMGPQVVKRVKKPKKVKSEEETEIE